MTQFISGELTKFFRISKWKYAGQEEEEIKEDSSTVLILQEQLCISELFRDIQDVILLILRYRRQCDNSEQLLPVQIQCRMCFQSAFKKTDSILSVC